LSGASSYTTNPTTFAVFSPTNTVTFNPPTSRNYWIVGTSGVGCKDSVSVFVDARPLPVVSAGTDDSICPGGNTSLQASGAISYVWTASTATAITGASSANASASPTVNTSFYVQGTDSFGCVGKDTVRAITRPLPLVNGGLDATICTGSSTSLGIATGAVSYSWTGPSILANATTDTPTVGPTANPASYIVTGTDIHGCQNTDTVQVTVNPLPVANAGANVSICTACTQLNASGGVNYSWSPTTNLSNSSVNNPTACVTTTTTYTVTVQDANGCVNTDAVTITIYPVLAVTASQAVTICTNSQTVISATGSGGDGGPYNYSWAPAAGIIGSSTQQNITVSPLVTTVYTVTITDQCGSVPVTATVQVTVNPLPVISFTSDINSGCTPICVNFTGVSSTPPVNCSYDFGDGNTATGCNPQHCYTTAGLYSVTYTVQDANGCQSSVVNSNMINAYPIPQPGLTVTPPVTSILLPIVNISSATCVGCDSIYYIFRGLVNDSTVTGTGTSFDFIYSQPGNYSVTQVVSNQYGCTDSTTETIVVEPDFTFYAPNAFTPDNDGINDFFMVHGDGLNENSFSMQIFNRWGKPVFATGAMSLGWDGQISGVPAQGGIYVWRVSIRDNFGKPHDFVGHVTLVR
jgi:gliding motility-associated-like protein